MNKIPKSLFKNLKYEIKLPTFICSCGVEVLDTPRNRSYSSLNKKIMTYMTREDMIKKSKEKVKEKYPTPEHLSKEMKRRINVRWKKGDKSVVKINNKRKIK